jgi:internalin A
MISSAEQLIRENMRTQAPSLDLGNCGLDGTEDCLRLLKDCGHLKLRIWGFIRSWITFFLKQPKLQFYCAELCVS